MYTNVDIAKLHTSYKSLPVYLFVCQCSIWWKFWCFANLIGENIPLQLLFSFFLLWMRLNIVLCLRDMNYCFFKCWCIYFIWYVEMLCVLGLLAICLQYEFASIFVWFLSVFDFACAYFARVILQSICQNCLLIFWCVFFKIILECPSTL